MKTNQKPDKCNYMQVIEGSERCLYGHEIKERPADGTPWRCKESTCELYYMKQYAPTQSAPDTTLRDEIADIIQRELPIFDHPDLVKATNKATQLVLDSFAKRLPPRRKIDEKQPHTSSYDNGLKVGWNRFESEVRAIIEGSDGS